MTTPARGSLPPLFEIENLSFTLHGRILLGPLSLSIPDGKVTALIGHNGSGKSTLIRILARQIAATGGQVRFSGKELSAWGNRAFAREIGYLPQRIPPATGMSVRELVSLGRYPWHGSLGRFGPEDRHAVEEALTLTDMETMAGRNVDTLSGGERQRAWLAMTMAQQPRCLLLDEPISALDLAHQVEVLDLVRRMSREKGMGVLVVLHDINMAARHADGMVALERGQVLVDSMVEEIVTPPMLERIHGIPMGVLDHPDGGPPIGYVRAAREETTK